MVNPLAPACRRSRGARSLPWPSPLLPCPPIPSPCRSGACAAPIGRSKLTRRSPARACRDLPRLAGPGAALVIHDIGGSASGRSGVGPSPGHGGFGGRRPVAQRRMRPDRVVVLAPVAASDRSGAAPRAGCRRPAPPHPIPSRLGHRPALCRQHIHLPQLGDDLLGLCRFLAILASSSWREAIPQGGPLLRAPMPGARRQRSGTAPVAGHDQETSHPIYREGHGV